MNTAGNPKQRLKNVSPYIAVNVKRSTEQNRLSFRVGGDLGNRFGRKELKLSRSDWERDFKELKLSRSATCRKLWGNYSWKLPFEGGWIKIKLLVLPLL